MLALAAGLCAISCLLVAHAARILAYVVKPGRLEKLRMFLKSFVCKFHLQRPDITQQGHHEGPRDCPVYLFLDFLCPTLCVRAAAALAF